MNEKKPTLTDPARELAELCGALQAASDHRGEDYLASVFGVEVWSREFYQIVFTIIERCSLVQRIIGDLDVDEDYKTELISRVTTIMGAFSATSMRQKWSQHGFQHVSEVHVGPLKAISGLARQRVAYARLSDDEIATIDGDVATLLEWLNEHQLAGEDFIRQALIEGLEHFRFRLSKLKWLGWGYTLDSLREVISAYMLLERSGIDRQSNPDAAAVLQKVGSVVQRIYGKVAATKDVAETGDWLLRAYGAGSLMYQSGQAAVAGLLAAT